MRVGLPAREMRFLEDWYEDYLYAKYGPPPDKADDDSDEETIADAPWEAEVIRGGLT